MRLLMAICAATMLPGGIGAAQETGMTRAEETYDLLFRAGTLDDLPRDETLVYDRTVESALMPDAEARDTGQIELTFEGDEPEAARLRFMQDERFKAIGTFPASVGNPIIMYFVETVVRDMAETAGGSGFYIRNRVKAALFEPAEIEMREVAFGDETVEARTVTLHPFEGDPNAARMQGFERMALTVTMSEGVPGWYASLDATVPAIDGESPIYSSTITLEPLE
ncbi:hypothetical protein [uncultured Jannaschia sp.]|uniref:hypothetical protein n=1 Tax=uncultured Jannaschia sp. TaxID=293347 RepID=UPI0026029EB6|nr:hypothetical protein [uncultured Jannaschia sp.]